MPAIPIDGKAIAEQVTQGVKERIEASGLKPKLSVILLDGSPASEVYVRRKQEACEKVGIVSRLCRVADCVDQYELTEIIERENLDPSVHGVLLQLPLPKHLDPHYFFNKISPYKDVDVFHPENVGLLVQGRPRFRPCTPHGIQVMLSRSGIRVKGKHVVVINRSDVVGKPLSNMLIQNDDEYANATVTVCHDSTPPEELSRITRQADIVIVAVGMPDFLKGDMIKKGSVVVDVGINRSGGEVTGAGGTKALAAPVKIVGDAHRSVWDVAGRVTKVPGGVGPMTVSMLLKNTLQAARMSS